MLGTILGKKAKHMATQKMERMRHRAIQVLKYLDIILSQYTYKFLIIVWWGSLIALLVSRSMDVRKFSVYFICLAIIIYTIQKTTGIDFITPTGLLIGSLYYIIASGVVASSIYFWVNYEALRFQRIGGGSDFEIYLSVFMVSVVLLYTYNEYGLPLSTVAIGVIFYAYFGWLFPGPLQHAGLSTSRIAGTLILNYQGIYGFLTAVTIDWIAMFLLYAGLVQAYGGFDYLFKLTIHIKARFSSGVAQMALVSSMLIGSITGSGVANTAVTGSLTIPTMKRSGIESDVAAGIESVASTGGQILPPVMGASAFIMAALLPFSYVDILLAAVIPAFIFYISVAFSIHILLSNSKRDSAKEMVSNGGGTEVVGSIPAAETSMTYREIAIQLVIFGLPFCTLLYLLIFLRYTISYTAVITVGTMILTGTILPLLIETKSFKQIVLETIDGFKIGAEGAIPIIIVVATINMIVDILVLSGTPGKLSLMLMDLSGGSLIFALAIAFILCIILGMGMPTPAAYLLVAVLIAPAIIRDFGLPELSVHMFVLYSAMLSMLTPPIAVCVVVASGIADSDFWQSCAQALRIGYPMFILPFVFIQHPVLVTTGFTVERIMVASTVLLGIALVGYGLNNTRNTGLRALLIKLGFIVLGGSAIYFSNIYEVVLPVLILLVFILLRKSDGF